MGYIIYLIAQTPHGRWVALILPFSVLTLNFLVLFGDWLPFRRGTQVNTISGVTGTQVGQGILEYDGYETRYVSFPRDLVPRDLKKQRIWDANWVGGWLSDIFAWTLTIPITAKTDQWIEIAREDLENPNGCVLYLGRLDGGELRDPDIIKGYKQIERLATLNSYLFTEFALLHEQVATVANTKTLDVKYMSEFMRDLADNVKRVIIQARGRGGGGSELSAIADVE